MLIVVALAGAAAALGVARGGSLAALSETRLRWPWLLIGGLLLQTAFGIFQQPPLTATHRLFVMVLANLALLIFIAGNRRMPGMLLADVGVALNLLVIVVNGAMPVSTQAARVAGIARSVDVGGQHEVMTSDTALAWLGDIVPVPRLKEVWSVGDFVLAAGIARLVYVRSARRDGSLELGRPRVSRVCDSPPGATPAPQRSQRRHRRARSQRRAWGGLGR